MYPLDAHVASAAADEICPVPASSATVSTSSFYPTHEARTFATLLIHFLWLIFIMATSLTKGLGKGSACVKCVYTRMSSPSHSSRQLLQLYVWWWNSKCITVSFHFGAPIILWSWQFLTALRGCSRQMFDRHSTAVELWALRKTSISDPLQCWRDVISFQHEVCLPSKTNENILWLDWWWYRACLSTNMTCKWNQSFHLSWVLYIHKSSG